MKAVELREMSVHELQAKLEELLREQFKMRMQYASGQSRRPHLFRQLKRDIARIKTILTEKERG